MTTSSSLEEEYFKRMHLLAHAVQFPNYSGTVTTQKTQLSTTATTNVVNMLDHKHNAISEVVPIPMVSGALYYDHVTNKLMFCEGAMIRAIATSGGVAP